ncbi:MAG: hypothetical protein NZ520_06015 [bacterium]|nr:hypothetical protein [bacterium]
MRIVLLERSMSVVAHVSAPPVILSAEQEIAVRTSVRPCHSERSEESHFATRWRCFADAQHDKGDGSVGASP